ncbi:MAG: methylmalonyl-CoA epimerase [bacterium]
MSILGIDHVAIAVESIDEALETYQDLLGETPRLETVESQGVRVAAFDIEQSRIELIEPLESDNPIGQFLESKGEGLHHIALRTDSVTEELDRAEELGIQCIDSEPREGADGYRIGFLHPESLNGTLVELAQPLIRVENNTSK